MVLLHRGFYPYEEDSDSAQSARKARGSKVNPIPLAATAADTASTHGKIYSSVDGSDKTASKVTDDAREANAKKSGSRRSRVLPEEQFAEQKPENPQLLLPPERKESHGSDGKKLHGKIENPSHEKNHKESANSVLLRITKHEGCHGCLNNLCDAAKKFKGVNDVCRDKNKDLIMVTGTMDVRELVLHLKKKLKKNVEVVSAEKDSQLAAQSIEGKEDVGQDGNIDGNVPSKSAMGKVHPLAPQKLVKQNAVKTEKPSRHNDGNGNKEVHKSKNLWKEEKDEKIADMVILKIRMYCQQGCVLQTQKAARKLKGVEQAEVDVDKDLVVVVGSSINVSELVAYLKDKLKRSVEVVLASDGNVAGENKAVERMKAESSELAKVACVDGRNKNIKEAEKELGCVKEKVEKYHPRGGEDGVAQVDKEAKKKHKRVEKMVKPTEDRGCNHHLEGHRGESDKDANGRIHGQHYGKETHVGYTPVPPYYDYYVSVDRYSPAYAPQIFSDENPNSYCSIM